MIELLVYDLALFSKLRNPASFTDHRLLITLGRSAIPTTFLNKKAIQIIYNGHVNSSVICQVYPPPPFKSRRLCKTIEYCDVNTCRGDTHKLPLHIKIAVI